MVAFLNFPIFTIMKVLRHIPVVLLAASFSVCSMESFAQHTDRDNKQVKTYKRKFYKGDEKYRTMNPQWPDEKPGRREIRKMERVSEQATAPARQEEVLHIEMEPGTRHVAPVTSDDRAAERRMGAREAAEQAYPDKAAHAEHAEGRANMDRGDNSRDERGSRKDMRRKARREKWGQRSERKNTNAED